MKGDLTGTGSRLSGWGIWMCVWGGGRGDRAGEVVNRRGDIGCKHVHTDVFLHPVFSQPLNALSAGNVFFFVFLSLIFLL